MTHLIRLQKILKISFLAASSAILMIFVKFSILPQAPFLKYDPSDIPVLIGAFSLGPVSGIAVALIKDLVYLIVRSSPQGLIGVPMSFLASATLAFVCGAIYHNHKTKHQAILALAIGVVSATAVMAIANYFILPVFIKIFAPASEIPKFNQLLKIIIYSIVPFNLTKGIINGCLVFLIYKKVSGFLKD